jgi:hypothetical protein
MKSIQYAFPSTPELRINKWHACLGLSTHKVEEGRRREEGGGRRREEGGWSKEILKGGRKEKGGGRREEGGMREKG